MVRRGAGDVLRPRGHRPDLRPGGARRDRCPKCASRSSSRGGLRRRVAGAYVGAHPYEEPAFDVYPVENEIASLGLGRLGAVARGHAAGGVRRRGRGRAAAAVGALRRRRRRGRAPRRLPARLRRRGHRARRRRASPTCSSRATSSTTRRVRRCRRGWRSSTRPTTSPRKRPCCAGARRSPRRWPGTGVRVETYRRPAGVWQVYDASASAAHPASTIEAARRRGRAALARGGQLPPARERLVAATEKPVRRDGEPERAARPPHRLPPQPVHRRRRPWKPRPGRHRGGAALVERRRRRRARRLHRRGDQQRRRVPGAHCRARAGARP